MVKRKSDVKLGLFKTKKEALKDAKQRRKNADNDINPNNTIFYRVEPSKNPKNKKRPAYYVVKSSRRKTNASRQRARKNLRR